MQDHGQPGGSFSLFLTELLLLHAAFTWASPSRSDGETSLGLHDLNSVRLGAAERQRLVAGAAQDHCSADRADGCKKYDSALRQEHAQFGKNSLAMIRSPSLRAAPRGAPNVNA